jgi:predicted ATPase
VRSDLPRGTVTFVFTDIEGSTRLIDELGEEGYVEALAEHRRVLRDTFANRSGVEVDTQGDAFFFVFAHPVEALAAAAEAQEAFAVGAIRVRMGLHTAAPVLTTEGYAGRELHRAARIAAVGHGGQVVVSAATAALVDGDLSELGEHRLRDFDEPVALFQLGKVPFPPLRTIANTNLPRPASSFIGRKREVAELVALLRDGARLLTLAGPGGSGKTRLAIEAAGELVGEFKAGVFWVGLAGLRESSLVLRTVAQTLGASDDLARHIEERELLLLLDNFEQVVDAAPELAALVETCPNLRVLVTSREQLRVRGEVRYEVPPLASADAVTLFSSRGQLQEGPEVAELCRRLDDLPLAVELAAARTNVLSPAQMLERLGERLDLFRGGRDAEQRQQTLRATIEWSYDMLREEEQRVFTRLAVFTGGCTVEAAEQVGGATLDVLQSVVDKSILRHSGERFWMLETIREYALEKLDASGDEDSLRRRWAQFLLEFARRLGFAYDSSLPERHDLVKLEVLNFRDLLSWAIENDLDLGVQLMAELDVFWGFFDVFEARRWTGALLERATDSPDTVRALALTLHAQFVFLSGDFEDAYAYAEQAYSLYQLLGDRWGCARLEPRLGLFFALNRGDPERGRQLCESGLVEYRRAGSAKGEVDVLLIQSYIEASENHHEKALELATQADRLCEQGGWSSWRMGTLGTACQSARQLSRLQEAERYGRQALTLALELDFRWSVAAWLGALAQIAAASGDGYQAGLFFGAVDAESERNRLGQWESGDRELVVQDLTAVAGPELERGIAEGRSLTLGAAAEFALPEKQDPTRVSVP